MTDAVFPELSEFDATSKGIPAEKLSPPLTSFQPGDTVKIVPHNLIATVIQQQGVDVQVSYRLHPRTPLETSVPANFLQRVSTASRPRGLRVLNLEALLSLPTPEWAEHRLLPKGGFAVMYGAAGSGKSFLSLSIAMSIATGRDWHGQRTLTGPVAYIAAEGFQGLPNRVRACLKRLRDAERVNAGMNFHTVVDLDSLLDDEQCETVITKLREVHAQYTLIVVDTLARVAPGMDENHATEMGYLIRGCDKLQRATGACVLLVHHSGKGSESVERGSSALRGAADTMLVVKKTADQRVTLTCDKQKDDEQLDPMEFQLEKVELECQEENAPFQSSCVVSPALEPRTDDNASMPALGRNEAKCLDAIRKSGTDVGLTSDEICQRSELKRTPCLEALKILKEKGYITSTKDGRHNYYNVIDSKEA